jgi:hypothetical protein
VKCDEHEKRQLNETRILAKSESKREDGKVSLVAKKRFSCVEKMTMEEATFLVPFPSPIYLAEPTVGNKLKLYSTYLPSSAADG